MKTSTGWDGTYCHQLLEAPRLRKSTGLHSALKAHLVSRLFSPSVCLWVWRYSECPHCLCLSFCITKGSTTFHKEISTFDLRENRISNSKVSGVQSVASVIYQCSCGLPCTVVSTQHCGHSNLCLNLSNSTNVIYHVWEWTARYTTKPS